MDSLTGHKEPPKVLDPAMKALWYDYQGKWALAHNLINDLSDQRSKMVHAYLHRKEGDQSNAEYWYRAAGKKPFTGSLEEEWKILTTELSD
ncbi:MAG: hypothetical protein FJZ78_03070 [Bacteroidetes bacterium]|nr:hypothetical protein [Bacteroidota bacterium]